MRRYSTAHAVSQRPRNQHTRRSLRHSVCLHLGAISHRCHAATLPRAADTISTRAATIARTLHILCVLCAGVASVMLSALRTPVGPGQCPPCPAWTRSARSRTPCATARAGVVRVEAVTRRTPARASASMVGEERSELLCDSTRHWNRGCSGGGWVRRSAGLLQVYKAAAGGGGRRRLAVHVLVNHQEQERTGAIVKLEVRL